jgi:hypothetical protein
VVALVNAEKKFFDLLDTEIARIHEFLESKTGEACMQMCTAHARAPHGCEGCSRFEGTFVLALTNCWPRQRSTRRSSCAKAALSIASPQ